MPFARAPVPPLRPFVERLWAADAPAGPPGARERVLPTGTMHLVLRLDEPLVVFDGDGAGPPRSVGFGIVGGARASAYVRDVSRPARSVGAQLLPGAAPLLLGVPASALAERHTALDALWGRVADEWRERVASAPTPQERLAVFEALLLARLPRVRGVHPAVAAILAELHRGAAVGEAVGRVGMSHRHAIALFESSVGLLPKRYARVRRFQRALDLAARGPAPAWATVALDAGYADQAHLSRDFRELAGLTAGAWRRAGTEAKNHVPVR